MVTVIHNKIFQPGANILKIGLINNAFYTFFVEWHVGRPMSDICVDRIKNKKILNIDTVASIKELNRW